VLAIKPQMMDEVLPAVTPHIAPGTVVISIAAGTTLEKLASLLPEDTPVIRAMPNTPSAVGRGITVCVADDRVSDEQRTMATALLAASGEVAWIDDESLMDAVTAVSGSGPAYVFWLTECLAEAGVAAGLPPDLAARLARLTVSGAGELMHRSPLEPARLRENVTSPAGPRRRRLMSSWPMTP
jgi:pyrroline-5-carboxylate reductase